MDFLGNLFNNFSGIMLCLFSRLQKNTPKIFNNNFNNHTNNVKYYTNSIKNYTNNDNNYCAIYLYLIKICKNYKSLLVYNFK